MPTIRLVDGDFGPAGVATPAGDELYLPDRLRPGVTVAVPLAAITEVDRVEVGTGSTVAKAAKLAGKGFVAAGPVGLAMGMFAVTKTREIEFKALLDDGRSFTAVTDPGTFAEFHTAQLAARRQAIHGDPVIDPLISRYLQARQEAHAETAPAQQIAQPAQPQPETPPFVERRKAPRPERPSFGRRRP